MFVSLNRSHFKQYGFQEKRLTVQNKGLETVLSVCGYLKYNKNALNCESFGKVSQLDVSLKCGWGPYTGPLGCFLKAYSGSYTKSINQNLQD